MFHLKDKKHFAVRKEEDKKLTPCLDAQNLSMELNCNEIPNPRWEGNTLYFNSAAWMYMIFFVGIKRRHSILIHVWMRKLWNRIGVREGEGKKRSPARERPPIAAVHFPAPPARCSPTRPGRGHLSSLSTAHRHLPVVPLPD
jgi:hypothetical protein